jgi:hypothetical protein
VLVASSGQVLVQVEESMRDPLPVNGLTGTLTINRR